MNKKGLLHLTFNSYIMKDRKIALFFIYFYLSYSVAIYFFYPILLAIFLMENW